jgi:hypothetical protein
MNKKRKKKSTKTTKKKASKKTSAKTEKVQIELQPVLVDNFISLQKAMLNLGEKFNNLNSNIQKLLDLFEISAKTLAKKDFDLNEQGLNKEVMKKLDNLAEQNKVIARGITLMHEKPSAPNLAPPFPRPQPTPQMPPQQSPNMQQYKKSPPSLPYLKKPAPKK